MKTVSPLFKARSLLAAFVGAFVVTFVAAFVAAFDAAFVVVLYGAALVTDSDEANVSQLSLHKAALFIADGEAVLPVRAALSKL